MVSAVWDLNYANSAANPIARRLLGNWSLSTTAQLQLGMRVSVGATGDHINDGNNFNDRAPLVGRGTIVGPGLADWDLRLTRDIF